MARLAITTARLVSEAALLGMTTYLLLLLFAGAAVRGKRPAPAQRKRLWGGKMSSVSFLTYVATHSYS
jgi:hypothetical protein